jgi:hypothetical protein
MSRHAVHSVADHGDGLASIASVELSPLSVNRRPTDTETPWSS